MTFLEGLQTHTGGLLHIKGELFWYGSGGWDGAPGRVCLVLDTTATGVSPHLHAISAGATGRAARSASTPATAVLLLIDGCPQWVWVDQEDVELIT